MKIDLSGQVAIVTGAGAGLGRAHALALAGRGARIVLNDLDLGAATALRDDIVDRGGEAITSAADVTDNAGIQAMVDEAIARWDNVDILVNNAGILRDRTFAKMSIDDFRTVMDVHLMGAVHCTKAVWGAMKARNYGRILFTTSSSGLYGNFGQSNYGAAKMALVGLMQTLALEGARYDIRVNCLAPSAATAMTASLYDDQALREIGPDLVSPAVLALVGPDAPTRRILLAGAGCFEQANITMTRGLCLGRGSDVADLLAMRMEEVSAREGEIVPESGALQYRHEIEQARAHDRQAELAR